MKEKLFSSSLYLTESQHKKVFKLKEKPTGWVYTCVCKWAYSFVLLFFIFFFPSLNGTDRSEWSPAMTQERLIMFKENFSLSNVWLMWERCKWISSFKVNSMEICVGNVLCFIIHTRIVIECVTHSATVTEPKNLFDWRILVHTYDHFIPCFILF